MQDVDVWFCAHGAHVWVGMSDAGEEPHKVGKIRAGETVGKVLARMRAHEEYNVVQVGILPPEMLGLE